MYQDKVFIYNVQAVGSTFTAETYFLDSPKAKYTQIGDIVTNNGNDFRIVGWSGYPDVGVSEGLVLTYQPVVEGSILLEDADYTSDLNTPGTYDVRNKLTVVGTIDSIIWEPTSASWRLVANWDDPGVANIAQVGDFIVDAAGRVFEVSFIDPVDRWAVEAKVKERSSERYGIAPIEGEANLFRPTQGEGLFTGTVFNQAVETSMWTRDNWIMEKWVGPEVVSGLTFREPVVIQSAHVSAKSFDLTYTPKEPQSVMIIPVGGPIQSYGDDYTVSGKTVTWNGLGLDGVVEELDKFLCFYQIQPG